VVVLYLPLIETVAPEIGAEVLLSMTCPVNTMLVGAVGEGLGVGAGVVVPVVEGDVGAVPPPLHADAKITNRTAQPGVTVCITASDGPRVTPQPSNLLPDYQITQLSNCRIGYA
jgi:hypothetical protein